MKFYTPELYRRFNDLDSRVAAKANDDWESADEAYAESLKRISPSFTKCVERLAKSCYHDFVVVSREQQLLHLGADPKQRSKSRWPFPIPTYTLVLRGGDRIEILTYYLRDEVSETQIDPTYPFHPEMHEWMYDEVDTQADGFVHRILMSDGIELEIPFVDVMIQSVPDRRPIEVPVDLGG